MCKLNEIRYNLKKNNNDKVILVKYGNFFRCYHEDAFILSYLLKYKISDNCSIGFPINTLDKVLNKLKDNNISCIVIYDKLNIINYNCLENNYEYILNISKNYNNVVSALKIINDLSYEILCNDLRKSNDILQYLKSL